MKTSNECISCFHKQARYAADLATTSDHVRNEIIDRTAELISRFDMNISPPENAVAFYHLISEVAENPDIFSGIKKAGNRDALDRAHDLADFITESDTPLETAARLAIAGNIIDYGSHQEFDIEKTIEYALSNDLTVNDLTSFSGDLANAQNILYLADNCGELVFDRLFCKTLNKPVTLAVKEKAIINDALMADALECGLDKYCRIISNGTGCPGTPLETCSKEFKKTFADADLIISKGQGNFETLSEIRGPIYFLLMVKCPVVAGHINTWRTTASKSDIKTGDMVIMKHRLYN